MILDSNFCLVKGQVYLKRGGFNWGNPFRGGGEKEGLPGPFGRPEIGVLGENSQPFLEGFFPGGVEPGHMGKVRFKWGNLGLRPLRGTPNFGLGASFLTGGLKWT